MVPLSLSLSRPTMEMPNGVITHHNRPTRPSEPPTNRYRDESGDYVHNVRGVQALLACSRASCWLLLSCGERGGLAWPTLHVPPSLPARPSPCPTHSLTLSPDSRTALLRHYNVTVTATAEYDRCPIITATPPSASVRPPLSSLIFFCAMPAPLKNNINRLGCM